MSLYKELGFFSHPFAKTNADEESELNEYFIKPAYFDEVVGDASSPCTSLVLAPRGGGKTALRRMVERQSESIGVLSVTYDSFELSGVKSINEVDLSFHLKGIITKVLISVLSHIGEDMTRIEILEKEERKLLGILIQMYLGDMTGGDLQDVLTSLRSLSDKIRKFWRENVGIMKSVVGFLLKKYELDEFKFKEGEKEPLKITTTYKYQLALLLKIVRSLDFQSIYILVDRVDETEKTGNDPEATYKLIKPLLKDLNLLGMEGFGFKFFIWNEVEKFYRDDARPDRITQYDLEWKSKDLKKMLSERIRAYSSNSVENFNQLVKDRQGLDTDILLSILSKGSPRTMIRLCESVLVAQSTSGERNAQIELEMLNQGVRTFAMRYVREIYKDTHLKEMLKFPSEWFTINSVASEVLKISQQAVRAKIEGWSNVGLVRKIGTVSLTTSKKPINSYLVVDPLVVVLISKKLDLTQFMAKKWRPCSACKSDNIIDGCLVPHGNEVNCVSCGASI